MAAVQSSMLELNTPLPNFELVDVNTKQFYKSTTLYAPSGTKGALVVFMCNHCPYVIHILDKFIELAKSAMENQINIVAISSNDVEKYPDDHPDKMADLALKKHFGFPYLYDENQLVAKQFIAECTPDFYLFDANQKLFYRGRFDASRPKNDIMVTGEDLANAIDLLLANATPPPNQMPSIGCNIKWKN